MPSHRKSTTCSRLRDIIFAMGLAFGVLGSAVADTDYNLEVCSTNNDNSTFHSSCEPFAELIKDPRFFEANGGLPIKSAWLNGEWCGLNCVDKTRFTGELCFCTTKESDTECLSFWGHMSYIGQAYDTTFNYGLVESGCGDAAPTINNRQGGYLRLASNPGNCIQSSVDPASGGATHLWNKCATGDNQRRRVVSYDTLNHELQFASKLNLCLVAKNLDEGSPIIVQSCDTATSSHRQWLLQNGQIQLKANTSKCMVTKTTSTGAGIVLGTCSAGDTADWKLQWTERH